MNRPRDVDGCCRSRFEPECLARIFAIELDLHQWTCRHKTAACQQPLRPFVIGEFSVDVDVNSTGIQTGRGWTPAPVPAEGIMRNPQFR